MCALTTDKKKHPDFNMWMLLLYINSDKTHTLQEDRVYKKLI